MSCKNCKFTDEFCTSGDCPSDKTPPNVPDYKNNLAFPPEEVRWTPPTSDIIELREKNKKLEEKYNIAYDALTQIFFQTHTNSYEIAEEALKEIKGLDNAKAS